MGSRQIKGVLYEKYHHTSILLFFSINSLTLCLLDYLSCFCRLLIFLPKSFFQKKSFRNIIRVSNSLGPGQARHFVGPDLGPNFLQRLSADDTST